VNTAPQPLPPAVARLRQAIRCADGIIIATPEYNHAIPGVLKNALDWASRPTTSLPLTGKLTTSRDGTVQLADPDTADAIQRQLAVLRDLISTGAARHLGDAMRQHVPARWW
jgi:chromate reductase, NAD(P)H dehydrogenase (quinone)